MTVWLVSDNGHRLLEVLYGGQPLAQARSDADGRFTLDVGAGSWLVGPAPAEINPRYEKKPTDIAPAGEHVLIAPEQTEAEVTLTCWRGLFLSGTVRGLEGELVDSGMVTVTGEGVYFSRSFGDGAFSMGPLPQGSYQVRASGTGADEHSDSEPVTAAAGTEGIELRLRKSSWLTVHVLDARGEPAAGAMVWIIGDERYGNRSYTGANGETRFDNLPRQTFALSAFGAAGEFALARNVTLDAGTEQREIELRLAPAARLRIEVLHGPERPLEAVIVLDGDEILVMDLADGAVTALAPGDYEVFLWGDAEEEVQRKSVHVAAEGETSVVFDLSAPR